MDAKELEGRLRDEDLPMTRTEAADGVAALARQVIAAENLADALRIIAYGPLPEDLDSPEAQVNFDNLIARTALAAWESAQ